MIDINKYCKYLYNSLYIPIYLYDNKELIACYPNQENETFPPPLYLNRLLESERKVSYVITTFYSYYGCIQIENSKSCIIIGPINDFPYSNETLQIMGKEFSVNTSNAEAFAEFFYKIPQQSLDTFINTLLVINYTLNNSELTRRDVDDFMGPLIDNSINRTYSENSFIEKEEGILNTNHDDEREWARYIETGNIVKLNKFIRGDFRGNGKMPVIANDNLRQWKNIFIVSVTLASRAAIRGGLSSSIARQLSDIYIQQVERLSDIEDVKSLSTQAIMDYTNRVANLIVPLSADNVIHQVIQFVRDNTNKHITVSDVAEHVGFTRSYLSRKVKKELGIELSAFIRRSKLEEAKDLLTFSNKTISEISNYLYFSSQSHFQTAFKEEYGITPNAFRKSLN
ncbi:helix-turn-helix domain-containing protein [Bacillus sp. USDA818B3_A]|uniref:helix-turn-helix domain-containing protein n=1 Tax=Bacillus sp. USDA818B3_A TaxID=2698834 RepID=UPI001371837F|nr:helix-turn-helix domain-containing protein [Bacillus sp. USDA818B3_A]